MIGKTLKIILEEKGMNVNKLAKLIDVSPHTLYSIIKRDNMKIDFDVLLKICNTLNVDVERFYSDYISTSQKDTSTKKLTESEQQIIELTKREKLLLSDFRKLSEQGQDYILQTMDMVKEKYKKDLCSPDMADIG